MTEIIKTAGHADPETIKNIYKTFVQINPADNQTPAAVKAKLTSLGLLPYSNINNEILIEVAANGLGISRKKLRAAVEPATVQMFDRYLTDDTDERHYYT